MTAPQCDRLALVVDYAAGDLPEAEAAIIEEHLFSCAQCGRRAAELDALLRGIRSAVRTAEVGGFVSDSLLNRLSREGVRIRTFVLSPGAIVPCAVWEEDELMVLRLRADFGDASMVTLSQRVGGAEVSRTTGEVVPGSQEILFATPAARVRELPVVEVDIRLTAHDANGERALGSYTLAHGGPLRR
jgi:hypothetical protein